MSLRSIPHRETRLYDGIPVAWGVPAVPSGAGWYQVISHPFRTGSNPVEPGLVWATDRTSWCWALPVPYLDSSNVQEWGADIVNADGSTYDGSPVESPPILSTLGVSVQLQQLWFGPSVAGGVGVGGLGVDFHLWDGAPVPGQVLRGVSGPLGIMAQGSANQSLTGTVATRDGVQVCQFDTGGPATIAGEFPFVVLGSETYADGDTVICVYRDWQYVAIGGLCSEE